MRGVDLRGRGRICLCVAVLVFFDWFFCGVSWVGCRPVSSQSESSRTNAWQYATGTGRFSPEKCKFRFCNNRLQTSLLLPPSILAILAALLLSRIPRSFYSIFPLLRQNLRGAAALLGPIHGSSQPALKILCLLNDLASTCRGSVWHETLNRE